jgi:phosphopentomutase
MITADHGCDPDPRWETTDHSREYVPILAFSHSFAGTGGARSEDRDLGTRLTLADMGQTIAENFSGSIPHGRSFLNQL